MRWAFIYSWPKCESVVKLSLFERKSYFDLDRTLRKGNEASAKLWIAYAKCTMALGDRAGELNNTQLSEILTRLRAMLPRGTSSVFNQSARKKKSAWLPLETFPVICSVLIGTERGLEKAKEFGLVHNSRLTFEKQDHLAWLWSADSTQRVPVITSAKLIALIFYACLQ